MRPAMAAKQDINTISEQQNTFDIDMLDYLVNTDHVEICLPNKTQNILQVLRDMDTE